jgi:hypothetical protein
MGVDIGIVERWRDDADAAKGVAVFSIGFNMTWHFFIFPKKAGEKKVYRNNSYILYFSKKKRKNKKIGLFGS